MKASYTHKRLYRVGSRPLDSTIEDVKRLAQAVWYLPLQTRTYADLTGHKHGLQKMADTGPNTYLNAQKEHVDQCKLRG